MSSFNNRLILIGGGGHCCSCIDVIEREGRYNIHGILDNSLLPGQKVADYNVLGGDSDITKYAKQGYSFLVTVGHVGNAALRKKLYQLVINDSGLLATIISPRAYIAKNVTVSKGTIVMHDALINVGTFIGDNCIINSKALIEHDCKISSHCHISTSAVVNGGVNIGEGTFFGSNATSKHGVAINKNSFIKANSCFVSNEMKKVAFLTTIYPTKPQYVVDFFESLLKQTRKKFDVLVVNDGYEDFDRIKRQFSKLNIIELPAFGSIAKNRQVLIQFAKNNNYDIAVFGDIDDVFSETRIAKSINALKEFDVVVNDLTSISKDGLVINKHIYSNRLSNHQRLSLEFIKEKNIFGLSNTAINLDKLSLDLTYFPDNLIAVDWYFFSLLLISGFKALFIADEVTFYRQYDSNTIGVGGFTAEKIKRIAEVRAIHYREMNKKSSDFNVLLNESLELKKYISSESNLKKLVAINCEKIIYPLWWELTR
ncbi:MAG: NeuD/PglB/VioB family sugar acetyltransferase [Pseudoalteromonas sp.]